MTFGVGPWAFGIPGWRELALVALVVLALYGRSGSRLLMTTRYGRSLAPWMRLVQTARPAPDRAGRAAAAGRTATAFVEAPTRARRWRRGRLYWTFVILAATALAAWVATRVLIHASIRGGV